MNWPALFDEILPEPAATAEEINEFAARLNCALPASFRDFLGFANGAWARTGAREFGFFNSESIVRYQTDYEFAEYMPGAVPLGLDGGGIFYVFDFRGPLLNDECPIWVCGSGANTWDEAAFIAPSFEQLCQGTRAAVTYL